MPLNRRAFARRLVAGGLGAAAAPATLAAASDDAFTFVHLADMHVRRKRRGHLGYAACVDAVNALAPRPVLALMGGDLVFDGLYTEKAEYEDQIALYLEATERLAMPTYPCIGNHDVLGWSSRRKVGLDDPDLGKALFMRRIGMAAPYYSFDAHGWHFVVLDCIHPTSTEAGPSYVPRLGEAQLDWLRHDLGAAALRPTVVMTHVAAFCNIGQINADPDLKAMNHMVLQDTQALRHILERHGVKAVLQGHSHMTEDFCYNGVWYLTSPAVSAAWWGGNWLGFEPGFTVFTARGDALTWQRHTFAWEHHLEPEDDLERRRNAERAAFLAEQQRLRAAEVAAAR